MAVRIVKRKINLREGYTFSSTFEERKTLEYIGNLISSKFLHSKPLVLFQFSVAALGQKTVVELLEKACPEICDNENFAEWVAYDRIEENVPANILAAFLKEQVLPFINKKLEKGPSHKDSDTEERLEALQNTFSLQKEEVEIVTFFYLKESSQLLDSFLDNSDRFQFTSFPMLKSHGDILLGLKKVGFMKVLGSGNLFKVGVMEIRHGNCIAVEQWCANYLSGLSGEDLTHEFFAKLDEDALNISDFEVSDDDLSVLDVLLKSNERQNILLYGVPGTGKTSFSRSLAKRYGRELFAVKTPVTDDHKERLRAIFATVNVADRDRSIVLVDEADEILRDLANTKIPFIMFSYCKNGGAAYENINPGSEWGIYRTGGLDCTFG